MSRKCLWISARLSFSTKEITGALVVRAAKEGFPTRHNQGETLGEGAFTRFRFAGQQGEASRGKQLGDEPRQCLVSLLEEIG
jgi:hypothetical protein